MMKSQLPKDIARSVRQFRICAHINLRLAREARKRGSERMTAYHLGVIRECRASAHALINLHR